MSELSKQNIFLVGPMGSGKSSVGRQLARKKKLRFIDCDQVIIDRTGVEISLIFEIEGENGFRKREKNIIDELTAEDGIVLATGGGAVLDPDNRNHLTGRGTVIYLRASIDQILKRTRKDTKRPLLNTDNPAEKLRQILAEREAYYEEVADMIIDTDNRTVKNVVEEICNREIKK
ncbi:MAG TPA: shikimate kinase AroK [Gammaproteobacteria bacterium]|nr:shikimate kinase AroK [Gammaproteobacteria bacterium]